MAASSRARSSSPAFAGSTLGAPAPARPAHADVSSPPVPAPALRRGRSAATRVSATARVPAAGAGSGEMPVAGDVVAAVRAPRVSSEPFLALPTRGRTVADLGTVHGVELSVIVRVIHHHPAGASAC